MKNIFNRLFRYKPEINITSSENFITESFVYLLEYSLINKTALFKEFGNLLRHQIAIDDYNAIFIDTQRQFETSYELMAIPDISIQFKNVLILIEVKYDSYINEYRLPQDTTKTINQIEKYHSIITKNTETKFLYTLTLSPIEIDFKKRCPNFIRKILWYEIYTLIKKYNSNNEIENYLKNEFLKFMEDIKMALPKVSYELINGMQAHLNLNEQIEKVLEDLKIPYKKSFGNNWTGYYILGDDTKDEKNIGWIGTFWEPDKLTFEFLSEKAVENIVKEKIEDEFNRQVDYKHYCKYFKFEENHYFCLKPQEQIDKLKDWIENNYAQLKRLIS